MRKVRRRPRVLVDVDEVLADFQTPALEIMAAVTGKQNVASDFEVWDLFEALHPDHTGPVFEQIGLPGFCSTLLPFAEGLLGIEKLRTIADVYAVTSPYPSRTWVYERTKWLKEHYNFDSSHVVHTSAKYLVRGDALVDDKPEHILQWKAEHPKGDAMLWHIPNTRTLGLGEHRVHSWDEVYDRVLKLAKTL